MDSGTKNLGVIRPSVTDRLDRLITNTEKAIDDIKEASARHAKEHEEWIFNHRKKHDEWITRHGFG